VLSITMRATRRKMMLCVAASLVLLGACTGQRARVSESPSRTPTTGNIERECAAAEGNVEVRAAQCLLLDALKAANDYYRRHKTYEYFSPGRAARAAPNIRWEGDGPAAEGRVSINQTTNRSVVLSTFGAEQPWCIVGKDGRDKPYATGEIDAWHQDCYMRHDW
jgi:hypothetical protein